jgi:hypothetical protein
MLWWHPTNANRRSAIGLDSFGIEIKSVRAALFHHGTGIEWSLDEPPANCDARKENIERHGDQIWFGGYGEEGLGYCVAQVPSPYGAPFGVSRSIMWDKNNRPQGERKLDVLQAVGATSHDPSKSLQNFTR